MRARYVWVYVGAGCAASGVHWLLPSPIARALAWDLLGLAAVVACWAGIIRNRPGNRRPWYPLALGVTLLASGDVVWDIAVRGLGHADTFVPASDFLYLGAYPFLAIGLLRLAHYRRAGRGTTLDAAVVALAVVAPLWQLVVVPIVDATTGSGFDRAVTVAYPLLDVVLIVTVVYTAFSLTRWNPAAVLLVSGIAATTAGDVLFARLAAADFAHDARWLDPIWPTSYTLLAAAMLHPSMRALASDGGAKRILTDRARAIMLGLALFSVPALLAIELETGQALGGIALAVVSAVISGLVSWRLLSLVRELQRAHRKVAASEERFRALVQHASDGVTVLDAEGRFLYMSPTVERILDVPAESFQGRTVAAVVHPDDLAALMAAHRDLLVHPDVIRVVEARFARADGAWRWIETTCTSSIDEPAIGGIVANFRDITARKRDEALGTAGTRALEMITRGEPLLATLEDLVVAVEAQLEDHALSLQLWNPDDDQPGDTIAPSALHEPVGPALWSVPLVGSEGSHHLGVLTVHGPPEASPAPGDAEIVERIAALAAVAVDRAMVEDLLEHQAFHDPLTGLPNRILLHDRLRQALLRLQRGSGTVAVLFLDLDRFKVINDSLGHDAGDELLLEVGRRLAESIQAADTVARFGGDEFVVVCERLTGVTDARAVAERLSRAVGEPCTLPHGGVVVPAVTIGIALAHGPNDRPETLLRDADAAMYRAKGRGGTRIEVFDAALRSHVVVRLETERALRRALERDELRVHYQPVVELDGATMIGAEALVRWHHPTHGLMRPGTFIDVAEETGLVVPMGSWMLEQTCRELAGLAAAARFPDLVLSVNLSGRQLMSPDLDSEIARHLDRSGIEAPRLCLEVTESVLLDDVDASVRALRALKRLGVRLAVDDFGTGYSSLGYLKQFPFDVLKIDQAFVAGLGESDADDTIVHATVQMAHALGMEVVAEGVETERQRSRAHELGCDAAQGYLFAPPQAVEEVLGQARRLRAVR